MAESDNVLTRIHDLLLYLLPQLAKFPRDQRFLLGDRIQTKVMDVQENCLRAYYGQEKKPYLVEANLEIEITRHLVRLAHQMHYLSNHRYAVISEKLDTIGRMIGGWVKKAKK